MLKSISKLVFIGACYCSSFSALTSATDGTIIATGRTIEPASSQFQLPKPTGRYGVGRASYAITDRSRPEPLVQKAGALREVMVEVWYPAEVRVSEHDTTAPYLPGFEAAKSKMSEDDIKDLFSPAIYTGSLPETHTVENAPIIRGNRKFPLLVFSHGWGNPTFLYTAELEDIASHGYIVAAVDHPYDTAFTQFPDGRIVLFAQKDFDAATKQPNGYISYARQRVDVMAEDNRFALSELLRYATTKALHTPFFQRIDETHIAAFGHSIGGLAAARTCQIDDRVKACMDQDSADDRGSPFIATDLKDTEQQPFLLFVAFSADVTSPRKTHPDDAALARMKISRPEYDDILRKQRENQLNQLGNIPGGAYRVTLYDLPGFVHRAFSDLTLLGASPDREQSLHNFRVAETFTLAFFDKYLNGDPHTVLDSKQVVDPRAKVEKFSATKKTN